MNENIPNSSEVPVEVSGNPWTKLLSAEGDTIAVVETDVQKWLQRGFSRVNFDPTTFLADMRQIVEKLPTYITQVEEDLKVVQALDPHPSSNIKVLENAVTSLLAILERISAASTTPTKQTVTLNHPTQGIIEADPSLVQSLLAEGASIVEKLF